jgi:hypothetical protein
VFLRYVSVGDVSYETIRRKGGIRYTTVRLEGRPGYLIGRWFCVERFVGFEVLAGGARDCASRIGAAVRLLWGVCFFVSGEVEGFDIRFIAFITCKRTLLSVWNMGYVLRLCVHGCVLLVYLAFCRIWSILQRGRNNFCSSVV